MSLPTNPIGLYWENYDTTTYLVDLPLAYNVFFLFQALPSGATGNVIYTRPGIYATNAALATHIATCRARGQRVILTCGGAGAQIDISSQAKADVFVAAIKTLNVQFGGSGTTEAIDGIDFNNFEQASDPNLATWMAYAAQQLKNYYGSDFLVTAPPAATNFLDQAETDHLLLATIYNTLDNQGNPCLDWLCPQFYDGPGLNAESQINIMLDQYHAAILVGATSVTIPRNRIGIGFAISSNSTWWTVANASAAYTDAVNDGNEPKGAFNFSANNNPTNSFATTVAPVINNNEEETDGLVEYDFTASSFAATTTTTGVSGSNVTDGSVSTPTSAGNNGYASDPVISISPALGATTTETAVSTNSYIQFTLTPNAGKRVSLTTLTFNAARGGAATPRGYDVRSSVDGYAATLGTADLSTQRPTFTPVSIDLSGANFQNQTSAITFRIYVYAPSTANVIDIDSISINGAVLDVPSGIPQLIIC